MVKRNFVHLHVHTKYSIGDGITDITSLQSKLEADWQRFKENPKWMIPENNK